MYPEVSKLKSKITKSYEVLNKTTQNNLKRYTEG